MTRLMAASFCRLLFQRIPLGLAALLLVTGVAINFINVIARYIFQSAIYWAEEAMIYMAIWSIFLAAIAIAYDGADLTMDFFSARLSEGWKRLGEAIIAVMTVVVCLFMALQSFAILRILIRNGQNSLALEVPMAVPQAWVLFGFVMIAAAAAARFFLRPQADDADASTVDETGTPS